jgi:hypothetical protein
VKRRALATTTALLGAALFLTDAHAQTPIIDMGKFQTYQGLKGGRYPDVSNVPPPNHDAEGTARAAAIGPIGGKVVLLAVGLSNSEQEWCGRIKAQDLPCNPWTFMGQADASPAVDHGSLVIVNGALSAQTTETWDEPTDQNYGRIEREWLTPLGLTPEQVQVVEMLEMTGPVFDGTSPDPATPRLPAADANAYYLVSQYGAIARTLKQVYPNLQMIFISPRSYGGYGTSAQGNANPEPYAYETGFATKLFIEAQLTQCPTTACNGPVDPRAGNLSYASGAAPWITWGAYLWANGSHANSEGLFYVPSDYQADTGQHPTTAGENKIGAKLLDFFLNSPYAIPWFTSSEAPPSCAANHSCLRSDIALQSFGRSVTATVTVVNDLGNPVADVGVTATWTLPDGIQVSQSGTTSGLGVVRLYVSGPPGVYTFQVTSLTKTGFSFDRDNSILQETIRR